MSLERWLQEQLFARRIVLVTGRLDDDAAAAAAAALRALDANADKPIILKWAFSRSMPRYFGTPRFAELGARQ